MPLTQKTKKAVTYREALAHSRGSINADACFGTFSLVMALFLSTSPEIRERREESPKLVFTRKRKENQ